MIAHIVRKDVRRLWPAIAVSLAVLGSLVWQDAHRSDWIPGEVEGYLNLLMPIVWACLIGLAVEQEPVVGDRQFWITRPYRRPQLVAAKLLFGALFVQLPSFAADCAVLAARGFNPLANVGPLLTKQLVLFLALTLPAMALASLVRSFSHFILELVAIAAGFLVLSGPYAGFYSVWEPFETVRRQSVVFLVFAGAAAILALQFFSRRIIASRIIGVAAGAAAALLFAFFVPRSALAIRAKLSPAGISPALRLDTSASRPPVARDRQVTLLLPIEVTGYGSGDILQVMSLWSEISGSGVRYREVMRTASQPDRPIYSLWIPSPNWDHTSNRQVVVNLDAASFGQLAQGSTTISGEAGVTVSRLGAPFSMGTSETRDVPGVGRCTTQLTRYRISEERLKVECESPRLNPSGTRVRLYIPNAGGEWKHTLGDGGPYLTGPHHAFLSPLERKQTYFDIHPDPHGADWQVPAAAVPALRVEITPQIIQGYSSMKYEFRDLDLRRYVIRQPYR